DRWLEVWNLVFMQYDRDAAGTLQPLPAPCVDTGMGLERVSAVVQGKLSNYETDLSTPLLEAAARRPGMSFLISDGGLPGNEGRGYVLRKIMRRGLRHGKKLGIEGSFLSELTGAVVERMKAAYPELVSPRGAVARVVAVEEDRFSTTLKQAFVVFEEVAARLKPGQSVPGADVFRLYDTYGLPADFTEELAKDRGLGVDLAGFERELTAQQERARQSSKMGAVKGDPVYLKLAGEGARTDFLGYTRLSVEDARVLAVLKDGQLAARLDAG